MTNDHWFFSTRIYAKPGVEHACLYLQDHYGVDINLLFLGLYAALELRVGLQEAQIAALDAAVRELRTDVIVPLRAVRRRLKRDFGDLRQDAREHIKKAELLAERFAQACIREQLSKLAGGVEISDPVAVAQAVVRYFAEQTTEVTALNSDPRASESIRTVVEAAVRHSDR